MTNVVEAYLMEVLTQRISSYVVVFAGFGSPMASEFM